MTFLKVCINFSPVLQGVGGWVGGWIGGREVRVRREEENFFS